MSATEPPPPTSSEAEPTEVLVVEDDQFNVKLLSEVCRASGYTVRVATDGVEALERIDERRPDLVLLDVMLPKLDGFGVLERLRGDEATRDLPVIVVTAMQDAQARARGIELGADDYVTKPFRIAELRKRIESTLAMSSFRADLG